MKKRKKLFQQNILIEQKSFTKKEVEDLNEEETSSALGSTMGLKPKLVH